MKPFKVLCIGGSDTSGGAGIQADLKTVHACGCWGLSVITAVTAQNTKGVMGIFPVTPSFVAKQLDAVLRDIGTDVIKTGVFPTQEIIQTVVEKIKKYPSGKVVVDPVMIAKGGKNFMNNSARKILVRELLPLAFAVTPNIPEAEVLSKIKIDTILDMKEAAVKIRDLGVQNVLIKGGHRTGRKKNEVTDILYNGNFYEFSSERIHSRDTHGTGCTYASALASAIARGQSMVDAALQAKIMVIEAIRNSVTLGEGYGSVNVLAIKLSDPCLQELQNAMYILSTNPCGRLIPEVQSNLVYALKGAQNESQVAAFPGRIVRIHDSVRTIAVPEFGASKHMAHVVLTVLKYDASFRSAMNIAYSENIIKACRQSGLRVDGFDRKDEPAEKQCREGLSLEWGVDHVLQKANKFLMSFSIKEVGVKNRWSVFWEEIPSRWSIRF